MNFIIRPKDNADSKWVTTLLQNNWGSTKIVTRGKILDASNLEGFIAVGNYERLGLITYSVNTDHCEIVTLDSMVKGIGIGSALIDAVKQMAVSLGCKRLWLITTNDNIKAMNFYQKHRFRLVSIYKDAIQLSRQLKPSIAVTGNKGIPIMDEIEFELLL